MQYEILSRVALEALGWSYLKGVHFQLVFIDHCQQYSVSFPSRSGQFNINMTSDWLNSMV